MGKKRKNYKDILWYTGNCFALEIMSLKRYLCHQKKTIQRFMTIKPLRFSLAVGM
jgi:hypothetical protein